MRKPETGEGQKPDYRYAWFVVVALLLVNILNFIDRQLPIILIESIKRDLHLSDTQIGLLAGLAFTLAYSIGALVLASASDRYSRKWVLVGSLTTWSIFVAIGGLAQNFTQFAVARLGVAIGESGGTPPAHAIITQYFPAHRRALPLALFSCGSSVGFMLGLMLGGFINDLGNWRLALFVAMPPGILLALIIALFVRESPNSAAPLKRTSTVSSVGIAEVIRHFLRTRSLRTLVLGGGFYGFALTGVTVFLGAFFIRSHGLSTSATGLMLGLGLGVGGGAGTIAGGYISDWAGRRDPRMRLWAPAIVTPAAVPLVVAALLVDSPTLATIFLGLAWTASAFYLAPYTAAVQSLVPAHMRATASAISLIFTQGVGSSIGAVSVGMLSDKLMPVFGTDSLRYALICGITVLWVGSALFFAAGQHLPEDLARAFCGKRESGDSRGDCGGRLAAGSGAAVWG